MLYEEMDEEQNSFSNFKCKLRLFDDAGKMPKKLSRVMLNKRGNKKFKYKGKYSGESSEEY